MPNGARPARTPGLLFIVNSLEVGGAEKQVIALINRIDTQRFRVHLAYLKRRETLLPQVDRARLDALVCCDVSRGLERRAVHQLRELIETRSIDVIVCTNMYSMLYGTLARSGCETRPQLVTVFHTMLLMSYTEKLQMLLYRRLIKRCDLLIYVCENQRRHWRRLGLHPDRDAVVHNGIDVGRFNDAHAGDHGSTFRQKLGFGPNDYVIGICSALRPEKAHGDLLEAIARLRAAGVDVKALLIGDGPERGAVERKIADLGIEEHVRITGTQQDVRPFIAACDVMALVSRTETFSIAALEAMALAKPLIMSEVGGASEQVIHGKNGLLFEPGDIDALVMHLRTLRSSALRQQMGAAGSALVRQSFTLEKMTDGFTEQLTELLRSTQARRPAWLSHYGHGAGARRDSPSAALPPRGKRSGGGTSP